MDALILAGGKGERLRPLTDDVPKPMIKINGKTILEYQINQLKTINIDNIILCVGHKSDIIYDYFKNGEDFGVKIKYSYEHKLLGRGGAIKQGMKQSNDSSFLVMNGDIITDFEISILIEDYDNRISISKNHIISLLTTKMISPYGIIKVNKNGIVTRFVEKPELPHNINAGIYVMSRNICDLLPDAGDHETYTFPKLFKTNSISAIHNTGFWKSIDSFKDLNDAEHFLSSQKNRL